MQNDVGRSKSCSKRKLIQSIKSTWNMLFEDAVSIYAAIQYTIHADKVAFIM